MESAAVLTTKDKNSIIGYRADVAYYTGDLKTAEKLYTQVAKAAPVVRNVASLARLHWKMDEMSGDKQKAAAAKASAEKLAGRCQFPRGVAARGYWLVAIDVRQSQPTRRPG